MASALSEGQRPVCLSRPPERAWAAPKGEGFPLPTTTRQRDELVFFRPPPRLREIADGRRAAAGQSQLGESTLFVKRVVAVPGDTVSTDADGTTHVRAARGDAARPDGRPAPPGSALASLVQPASPRQLARGAYWVLGDNPAVSVDSRCWGELAEGQLVGRPLVRVLPLSRFGVVDRK